MHEATAPEDLRVVRERAAADGAAAAAGQGHRFRAQPDHGSGWQGL